MSRLLVLLVQLVTLLLVPLLLVQLVQLLVPLLLVQLVQLVCSWSACCCVPVLLLGRQLLVRAGSVQLVLQSASSLISGHC